MQNIQEVFNRIQAAKKEQKEIKTMYRDALVNNKEYTDLIDEIKTLRERKKSIEATIQEGFHDEFITLEQLKTEIQSDQEMLSDIAFN